MNIKALLLVGGMGTRLRSVALDKPKPLVSVGPMPFLELLVCQLRGQGVRRLVMCTGYLAEQIEQTFGTGCKWDVEIEYSQEPQPLGTAGAVKLASRFVNNLEYFIVMNGDSFLQVDFTRLLDFHNQSQRAATMAVLEVGNSGRYGTVRVNSEGRVTAFVEKTGREVPEMVSGGVYVFNRRVLDVIPDGNASLEREIFPLLLGEGIYALEQPGMFIDIGTPDEYARAQEMCDRLRNAATANGTASF